MNGVAFMGDNHGALCTPDRQLENVAAELSSAVYAVMLRRGFEGSWLDLELSLWGRYQKPSSKRDLRLFCPVPPESRREAPPPSSSGEKTLMRYCVTFRRSSSVVVALGLGLAGCTRGPTGAAPAAATPVSVSYPVERAITRYADFTGRLEAVYSVEIRARVTGYLDRVYFKDGDEVNEGASLFEIDPRPYKVELDRAEASLAQQEAHLKRLDADYRRAANLFARGNVSREEFDRYAGDRVESDAAVGIARANRDMAKLNFGFTNVPRPDRRPAEPAAGGPGQHGPGGRYRLDHDRLA